MDNQNRLQNLNGTLPRRPGTDGELAETEERMRRREGNAVALISANFDLDRRLSAAGQTG
jgi:hypothetical protein